MSHDPAEKKKRAEEESAEFEILGKQRVGLAPHTKVALNFNDVRDGIPTGVWVTGAPVLWKRKPDGTFSGVTGKGVLVGVIDTGIDDSHPDLIGKVVKRHDFVKDGARPSQFDLHGTHVAGTIAANGTIKGVAPDAKLIDYRVLGLDGSGSYDAIVKAIKQSIVDGCNIINMSLGGPSDYPPMRDAIIQAVSKGILVVVAAGNEGREGPPPHISYPANYPEVVCVGAVDFDTRLGKVLKIDFSSASPQVDVAVDGYRVVSTAPGARYEELSGTSMACPHVAGFAALLLQKCRIVSPNLPTDQVESTLWAMLKDNTVDVFDQGLDWSTGAGFVTAYPALPSRDTKGLWRVPGLELGQPL